ncbi:unnamed protein product [Heterobilharzia americana]|nr:unnamed protein product [Heterobilharzia americana]
MTNYLPGAVLKTTDIDDIPSYVPEYNAQDDYQHTIHTQSVPQKWTNKEDQYEEPLGKSELDLRQVAYYLKSDWRILAQLLGLSEEDEYNITSMPNRPDEEYAYTSLLLWQERIGNDPTSGTQLAEALQAIGRKDVLEYCMTNVSPVITKDERAAALRSLNGISSVSPNLSIYHDKQPHSKQGNGLSESIDTGYGTQSGSTTQITTTMTTASATIPIMTEAISSMVSDSNNSNLLPEVEQEIIQPITVKTGRVSYSKEMLESMENKYDNQSGKYDVLQKIESVLSDSPSSSLLADDKNPCLLNLQLMKNHLDKSIEQKGDISYSGVPNYMESSLPAVITNSIYRPILTKSTTNQIEKVDMNIPSMSSISHTDKADEQVYKIVSNDPPCEEEICPHHHQRCGELEATWGKGADHDAMIPRDTDDLHIDSTHDEACKTLPEMWGTGGYMGKGADRDVPRGASGGSIDKEHDKIPEAAQEVIPFDPSECTLHHQQADETEVTASILDQSSRFSADGNVTQPATTSKETSRSAISKHKKLVEGDEIRNKLSSANTVIS